jgi:hypothetical protein
VKYLVIALVFVFAVFVMLAFGFGAHAAVGYSTDSFVRMIERKLSGDAHIQIGPGTTVTSPECGCSVKYLGTKINGHVYAVYLDKLD